MPTDFEKRFGDYGDLTDPLGLAPAAMEGERKPIESQTTRIMRLLGKGATFGLAQGGQDPIEAESIPEHIAEFGGSIPSTMALSTVGGFIPGLAKLAPFARGIATSGALGGAVGAGRAAQTGDITDIPTEAAWWAGSDIVGQGILKGGAKLFGRAKAPKMETPELHGPPTPTAVEKEFYESLAQQETAKKGNIVNSILNPNDFATKAPGERAVFPSTGPRTLLPPKNMTPPVLGEEGPAVRLIKVGEDTVNFEEIPDLVLGKNVGNVPRERMVELHRAEAQGTTGETFTTDRTKAFKDAKTVGGYLKTIEVPEGELAQYKVGAGDKYRIPQAKQNEIGVSEHQPMDRSYYEKELAKAEKDVAKIRPAEERPAAEMYLEDEFGRTVAGEGPAGPEFPLTRGQEIRRNPMGPIDESGGEAFRVITPERPYQPPQRRPSLDGFIERTHENPIRVESMDKPLKETVDKATGTVVVTPKTQQAAYMMDAASRIPRNVEPPITPAMKTDLNNPLNKAKLDHGVQSEQYRTSNLITKDDAAIDLITRDAEGRWVVKPTQFVSIEEAPLAAKAARNLERQGMTHAEIMAFVDERTKFWDMTTTHGEPITKEQISARLAEQADVLKLEGDKRIAFFNKGLEVFQNRVGSGLSKKEWMKNEIHAELRRRC